MDAVERVNASLEAQVPPSTLRSRGRRGDSWRRGQCRGGGNAALVAKNATARFPKTPGLKAGYDTPRPASRPRGSTIRPRCPSSACPRCPRWRTSWSPFFGRTRRRSPLLARSLLPNSFPSSFSPPARPA